MNSNILNKLQNIVLSQGFILIFIIIDAVNKNYLFW